MEFQHSLEVPIGLTFALLVHSEVRVEQALLGAVEAAAVLIAA